MRFYARAWRPFLRGERLHEEPASPTARAPRSPSTRGTAPPIGAEFWSLSPSHTGLGISCVWNFGNVLPNTAETFGGDAQYGPPDLARLGGTIISAPQPNSQFSGRCTS